jgi:uncharacterized protein YprB with RNaseH-like and TPR domain
VSSIGFFDIETTGLKPQQHRFLTAAIARNLEPDPWLVVNLSDSEAGALITTRDWLESLDRVVSWAGNAFDIPFMNYRLVKLGERKLDIRETHFDLKAWAKRYDPLGLFALEAREHHGLEAHCKAVGIATKDTPFDEELWGRATEGDVDSLIAVAQHNVEDVISLRNLYDKLYEPVDERKRQLSLF